MPYLPGEAIEQQLDLPTEFIAQEAEANQLVAHETSCSLFLCLSFVQLEASLC